MIFERARHWAGRSSTGLQDDIKVALALFAILCFVYFSALTIPFGMADDMFHFAHYIEAGSSSFFWEAGPKEGRIIQGALLSLLFRPESLASFQTHRLIQLVGDMLLAFLFYKIWRRTSSKPGAFCLALILIALPFAQAWLAWAMLMLLPYAAFMAGLSALVLDRAIAKGFSWGQVGLIFVSVLLLWCALNIYQPAAMFFWSFALLISLQKSREMKSLLFRSIWNGTVGFAGLGLAFIAMKVAERLADLSAARTGLVAPEEIMTKLTWFIKEPLVNALMFNVSFRDKYIAIGVLLLMLLGLSLYLKGTLLKRVIAMVLIGGHVLLAYLANLIIAESWATYRTLAPLSVMVLVLAVFAVIGIIETLSRKISGRLWSFGQPVLVVVTAFFLFTAAYNFLFYFSLPMFLEHRLMNYQLSQLDLQRADEVVVFRANWSDLVAPGMYYDEFGMPATFPSWGVVSYTRVLLWEIDPSYEDMTITSIDPDPSDPDPVATLTDYDSVVVDMRRLKWLRDETLDESPFLSLEP